MRKLSLLLIVLILGVSTQTVKGQYTVTKEETKITIVNPEGSSLVDISSLEEQDDMLSIRVAGVEIVLNNGNDKNVGKEEAPATFRKVSSNKKRVEVNVLGSSYKACLELGMNAFTTPDYSLYPNPAVSNFMELNNAKSAQWTINVLDVTVWLNQSRTIAFSAGLQLLFNDYVFSENVAFVKEGGMLQPIEPEYNYKKSKIYVSSQQVPIMFHFGSSKSVNFSVGVYGGVIGRSNTKVKYPKERMYDLYMNPFYAGATARFGYRKFYVYGNYNFTDMFKTGRGPALSTYSFGLGVGF